VFDARPVGRPVKEERSVTTDSVARSSSGGVGYTYGGPAFVGGILAGLGLGIMLGDVAAWLLIGLGAGFILMAFIAALGK
jgi:hypothetical protein